METIDGSNNKVGVGSVWKLDGPLNRISIHLSLLPSVRKTFENDGINENYYKVLEVEYDATDEKIRLNYRKLALKWHPDKHNGDSSATTKFQEINEAYKVLSDPAKRLDYDITGNYWIDKYTLREYLTRFKGMILTCNGLGISHTSIWVHPAGCVWSMSAAPITGKHWSGHIINS